MPALPAFNEMRRNAFQLLTEAETELSSDWSQDNGPSDAQAQAVMEAQKAIADAKTALDRASP